MKTSKLRMAVSLCGIAIFFIFAVPQPLFAKENVEDLKKQIDSLRAEIAEMKAAQQQSNLSAAGTQPDPNVMSSHFQNLWDPFSEMQQMQDQMNRLFRQSFSRANAIMGPQALGSAAFYEPDVDIQDMKDHYVLTLDLPGIDKDKINIEVTEHVINISGERNYQSENKDERKGFYRMERRFGAFSRQLPLPADAVSEGVDAKYDNGVLRVVIPKAGKAEEKEKSKHVTIG